MGGRSESAEQRWVREAAERHMATPEWQRSQVEYARWEQERIASDPELAEHIARYEEASAPILRDLSAIGIDVPRLPMLPGIPADTYAAAEPVLLRWLARNENSSVQWDLAVAVCRKEAGPQVARAMIRELRRWRDEMDNDLVLQGLAGVIAKIKVLPEDVADETCSLAADPSYGSARMNLADALIKIRNPRAGAVLIDMLGDPRLAPTAAIALGWRRDPAGRAMLEELVDDPDASVRRQASTALRRLEGRPRR